MTSTGLRIAIYGTGKTGRFALEQSLRAGHSVVAGIVHTPGKLGADLGELCGISHLGVEVSDDLESALTTARVDVLFYTGMSGPALVRAVDTSTRLGIDFVTATFVDPLLALGDQAARIEEQACASGSRVLGSGMTPGLWVDYLPGVLATALPDPVTVFAQRISDPVGWGAAVLRSELGIGGRAERVPESFRLYLQQSAVVLGEALGVEPDRTEWMPRLLLAPSRLQAGGVTVENGQVLGFDHHVRGIIRDRLIFEIGWRAELGCELRGVRTGLNIRIEGPDDQTVRAHVDPPADGYAGTVARVLHSLCPLRSLPGGLYNPAHIPLAVPVRTSERGSAKARRREGNRACAVVGEAPT